MKNSLVSILLLLMAGICITSFAQRLPTLIPYIDNGLWGYCDSNGKVLIKPRWQKALFFRNGRAVVLEDYTKLGKGHVSYCLIDAKGTFIIPPSRYWTGHWDGWAYSQLNTFDDSGRWGLVDTGNRLLIPYLYDELNSPDGLGDSLFRIQYKILTRNGLQGVIDSSGRICIPFDYCRNTLIPVGSDGQYNLFFRQGGGGKYGCIDVGGNVLLPPQYDLLTYADKPRKGFRVNVAGKWGWKDLKTGGLSIGAKYDDIRFITPSLMLVLTGHQYGIVDTNEHEIVPCMYSDIRLENDTVTLVNFVYTPYSVSSRIRSAYWQKDDDISWAKDMAAKYGDAYVWDEIYLDIATLRQLGDVVRKVSPGRMMREPSCGMGNSYLNTNLHPLTTPDDPDDFICAHGRSFGVSLVLIRNTDKVGFARAYYRFVNKDSTDALPGIYISKISVARQQSSRAAEGEKLPTLYRIAYVKEGGITGMFYMSSHGKIYAGKL